MNGLDFTNILLVFQNLIFVVQVVGKGAFGTVYKAKWRENFVAVKYIELETQRNAFRIEVT